MGEQGIFTAQVFCNVFLHNLSINKFNIRGRRYVHSLKRKAALGSFIE